MRWLPTLACAFLGVSPLGAQDAPKEPAKTTNAAERSLDSLTTIAEPLAAALAELQKLQEELGRTTTEDAKGEIQSRMDAERERIRKLRENFRDVVGGSEAAEYDGESADGTGIREQVSELVQPVLSEIRDATAEPRELDKLRKDLGIWEERKRKADVVLSRIDALMVKSDGEILAAELKSARGLWSSRQAEALSQIAVIRVQIDERMRDRKSLWETLSGGFSRFFKSRGMNLLIAVIAAAIGFFATRKAYFLMRRISPVHKGEASSFTRRLSDVLAMAVAVLVSLAAVVVVFYVRGDWLLLTLVVIFLIGVAWAGKTAIPPYLEQIRMILNLGPVREGERVVYNGLPWKVSSLGFYTTFTNPMLQGGLMRIPIRDVMGMVSRPIAPKEVWFPAEEGDWVSLSDGIYGKAVTQTPEQVVVLQLGGSMKTYPTAEFLKLAPENLSHGFRISTTFGIDYRHQQAALSSIPGIFQAALHASLIRDCGRDAVRSIQVEFAAATASSLDFMILADFDGSQAQAHGALKRKIHAVCVEVCNREGWTIPFTQIMLHQAGN